MPALIQMHAGGGHQAEVFMCLETNHIVPMLIAASKLVRGPSPSVVEAMVLTGSSHFAQAFSEVVIATGHHWDARWPQLPGTDFAGKLLHAQSYRNATAFANKRVLVLGVGNSGENTQVILWCATAAADTMHLQYLSICWSLSASSAAYPLQGTANRRINQSTARIKRPQSCAQQGRAVLYSVHHVHRC